MAKLGIRRPGRHATTRDHFLHHGAPTRDVFVVGQRERTDLAFTMALHAAILHDRSNVLGVSDFALWLGLRLAADDAAGDLRRGDRDWLRGQDFVDGVAQAAFLQRRTRVARAVALTILIVDATAITNHAILIEDEYFRVADGAKLVGD